MLRVGGERDEVRVVADQVGCPTYTGHLARALVEIAGGADYGVHHAAAAGSCSWYELAAAATSSAPEWSASSLRSPPRNTPFPRPARRTRFSAPSARPCFRRWQDGLDAYLAEREVRA